MKVRYLVLLGAAVGIVALLACFGLREKAPVVGDSTRFENPPQVPVFPQASGTVTRALAPSSLGARDASARLGTPAPSSEDVAAVIDAAGESLEARLAALGRLGRRLSAADVESLLGFLDRRDGEDALPPERLNALKNDVANLLRRQAVFPESLVGGLSAMWRNPGHDEVWRDYCIQHLGASWNRVVDPAVRVGLGETLWAASGDASLPGAGTALIALRNLAEAGDEERANVADRAFACAAAAESPEGVRVTALQVASGLGHADVVPFARSLLTDRRQPVHLRMSAIAALGASGDASDLPALKALAASSEPRLRAAASAAIKRLDPVKAGQE